MNWWLLSWVAGSLTVLLAGLVLIGCALVKGKERGAAQIARKHGWIVARRHTRDPRFSQAQARRRVRV